MEHDRSAEGKESVERNGVPTSRQPLRARLRPRYKYMRQPLAGLSAATALRPAIGEDAASLQFVSCLFSTETR